ncbi:LuxR C-terminal-related transcriptional regulator [Serratia rubidaea]|uniref:LuxR C-terminal-related transcriptional regulator n=1 Tax=Serratia rubidaea TaxID=61652 RepID=UPI002DBC3802|nr:LuxR C-terminal-related transcriptional regulator [Serratia rubidaea]MEB7586419.1 LuxR C-terminal-related transcriptional regulator [Serratia rubidaea]
MKKILIFDENSYFRQAVIQLLLAKGKTPQSIMEAGNKAELESILSTTNVDTLLLSPDGSQADIQDNFILIRECLKHCRRLSIDLWLMVDQATDFYHQLCCSHPHYKGVISKRQPLEQLSYYIFNTLKEELSWKSPPKGTLSYRESQILLDVLCGDSSNRLTIRYGIQSKTISAHKLNALAKLGLKNISDIFKRMKGIQELPVKGELIGVY